MLEDLIETEEMPRHSAGAISMNEGVLLGGNHAPVQTWSVQHQLALWTLAYLSMLGLFAAVLLWSYAAVHALGLQ